MKIKLLVVGPLLTNCYLLISGGELLIIDPGGGVKNILREISQTKTKPKYILNTHCHWDHTFGNKIIKEATGAKILIHKEEKDFIKFEVDRFLKDGDAIKIGDSVLKVLHTPGHTRGSICLLGKDFTPHHQEVSDTNRTKKQTMQWISSIDGARFIFTGDTLFKDGHGRTDLPGGSEKDLEKSLEKLKKILKPGMTIYPGHGEIFNGRYP